MIKNTTDVVKVLNVKKKGKNYLVSTSDISFTCNEELLVEGRIFKGKTYTLEEWDEVLKLNNYSLYLEKALNYCSYKLRTKSEIELFLKQKEAPLEIIQQVTEKLTEYHLLDDEVYTKESVLVGIKNKKGPKYIKYNLLNKGIKEDQIDKYLSLYNSSLMIENIDLIINNELPHLKTYPILKQKEKLKNKLLRLGFTEPFISSELKKVEFKEDIIERLNKDLTLLLKKDYDELKIKQKLYQKGYSYKDIKTALENINK